MGRTTVSVPLETSIIRNVDLLRARGRFTSRGEVIAAVVTESLRRGRSLTPADVRAFVCRGRAEFRRGKARVIGSSAELR